MYIVTQLVGQKEKKELEQTFVALDKNGDGKLSKQELIDGYAVMYGSTKLAAKEVDQIMDNVDVDHNGYIDYSEFLVASMNKRQMLSKTNLQKAFRLFDRVSTTDGETRNRTAAASSLRMRSRPFWESANASLRRCGRTSSARLTRIMTDRSPSKSSRR